MSLINKMLRDLDARGGAAGAPPQATIKPVVREARRPARWLMAGGALLLASLVAGGYVGWRALRRPPVVVLAAPVAQPVKSVLLAPLPPPMMPVEPAAAAVEPAAPAPAPVRREAPSSSSSLSSLPPPPPRMQKRAEKPLAVGVNKPAPAAAPSTQLMSAAQRAESEYRRALATLAEGRTTEAIAGLERVLHIDSHHEAARQTLVGLLIENKQPDDAMRQLQPALAADPHQPAMAVLLARLQIERGGSGIDVLLRTLPFAAGNADYLAFFAGALQRQQRHREAAEQYLAALRTNPQNGVWLMGLGISLQAEKRTSEARDAFRKAKASASLTPELQAFVERRLVQINTHPD